MTDTLDKAIQLTTQVDTELSQITEAQLQLSEKVGALRAFDFASKMLTVSTIKMLAEIKESKQYKGLRVLDNAGKLLTVSSWADFCNSLGVSRQKIDLDIQNLSAFGEDFLEASQRMGVGYRDLRKLRQLPDDAREIIIHGEAMQVDDKEGFIELLNDVVSKNNKDKSELEQQLADEKAERKATDKVIEGKNKKIDELEKQLARETTASPYDRATQFAQAVSVSETAVLQSFGEIDNLFHSIAEDDELPEVLRVNQGQLLVAIKDYANQLIDKYGLGDISTRDDALDWAKEAAKGIENGDIPAYVSGAAE